MFVDCHKIHPLDIQEPGKLGCLYDLSGMHCFPNRARHLPQPQGIQALSHVSIFIPLLDQGFHSSPFLRIIFPGTHLTVYVRCMALAGLHEYYNVSMFTTQNNKHIQNRIIWAYYVVRNFLEYGKCTNNIQNKAKH